MEGNREVGMAKRFGVFLTAMVVIGSLLAGSPVSAAKGKERKQEPPNAAKADQASKSGIISKNPYAGAIVIDAKTGNVLFEENPDAKGYPASITKLMVLLIFLDAIESKRVNLQDPVTVTAEASRIGGSQVYLKENEVFPVEDLLYATIVQSANDAATALAIHYAGDRTAFVDVMNKRAQEIGMKDTVFHSVHGLPPGKDQLPDTTTPRDLAKLSQELLKHPLALNYTSTKERPFRAGTPEPFIMRSHNHLLERMDGCDGLKTGYFTKAGFSIAATATKQGARAIAVVLGSADRKVRDAKAREFLSKGLMKLVAKAPPSATAPAVQPAKTATQKDVEVKTEAREKKGDVIQIRKGTIFTIVAIIIGILALLAILYFIKINSSKDKDVYVP